jgi:NitT/TauT family transport system permease protein
MVKEAVFEAPLEYDSTGNEAGKKMVKIGDLVPVKIAKRIVVLVLLLTFWEAAPRFGWVDKTFLPSISTILLEFGKMIKSGMILRHVSISLFRSVSGFSIAILIGIPLGLVIGWYKTANELLGLPLDVMRNTSALAMLPVFMLFLGIGEVSKVTIVCYGCLWPILLNTISGITNVDPMLIMLAKSMGLSSSQMFRKIIVPAAIPSIFTGLRISSASSVLVIIAAEMVGAKSGLGYLITNAQFSFLIPRMFVGILTITILGVTINGLILIMERHFLAWKPKTKK